MDARARAVSAGTRPSAGCVTRELRGSPPTMATRSPGARYASS